jgi:hypothetical protein
MLFIVRLNILFWLYLLQTNLYIFYTGYMISRHSALPMSSTLKKGCLLTNVENKVTRYAIL